MAQTKHYVRDIQIIGFPGFPRKVSINEVQDFSVVLGHGKSSLTRAIAFVLLDDKIIEKDQTFYGNLKDYGMSVRVSVSSSSGDNIIFERRISAMQYPKRNQSFFLNGQKQDLYLKHPFSNQLPLSAENLTDFIKEEAMDNDLKNALQALSTRFPDTEAKDLVHLAHLENADRSNLSEELQEKVKEFNRIIGALHAVTAQRNLQILLALRTDEKIKNAHVINMNNSDLYPNH
ncbi:Protein CBG28107 [Caenorhabditis briggsae]|uniref:Protein CBG28107 n=1 Tax=Caenorhabditis briggsae TaxID=6238 RepID=B6IGU6_CAEBR|nr:Protein CBG28107 [Caenorhabditis briggsae]CAR99126.1 Protein CBG28107 [Caenorhabditis briggsae]